MSVEFEVVEILDNDDDDFIVTDPATYSVVEVEDDDGDNYGDDICIEDITPSENYEEADMVAGEPLSMLLDPEIEEPDDIPTALVNDSIKLIFNGSLMEFTFALHPHTTVKDLFALIRYEFAGLDDSDELWFHFEPLGLEIGEENLYTQEPTLGHMLRLLSSSTQLRVDIKKRQSFYSKFNDLLSTLELDDRSNTPSKKMRLDEMSA